MKKPNFFLQGILGFVLIFSSVTQTSEQRWNWTLPNYSEYILGPLAGVFAQQGGEAIINSIKTLSPFGDVGLAGYKMIAWPVKTGARVILNKFVSQDSFLRNETLHTALSYLPAGTFGVYAFLKAYENTPRGLYESAKKIVDQVSTAALSKNILDAAVKNSVRSRAQTMWDGSEVQPTVAQILESVNKTVNSTEKKTQKAKYPLVALQNYLITLVELLDNAQEKTERILNSRFTSLDLQLKAKELQEKIATCGSNITKYRTVIETSKEFKAQHKHWCTERGVGAQEQIANTFDQMTKLETVKFSEQIISRYGQKLLRIGGSAFDLVKSILF